MKGWIDLADRGWLPDRLVRAGIRMLNSKRLQVEDRGCVESQREALARFIDDMCQSPIAVQTEKPNEQHYEIPPAFFKLVLGKYLKYSSCFWDSDIKTLDEAEERMLAMTAERAQLSDGMDILELGCGWGALSLWMAEKYPGSHFIAVSNSEPQREFIRTICQERGLTNLKVITADMNVFSTDLKFDRVVSVEMFEHMRNYAVLFERISRWLKEDGAFFMHIFCHRSAAYEYIDNGPSDWMSRHFFSGGIMPAGDLPAKFQDHLRLADQWRWSGRHYQETAEAWLRNMDARKAEIMPILEQTYGREDARRWWSRWRIFFLAVSEMFGVDDGRIWGVGHYLFHKQTSV